MKKSLSVKLLFICLLVCSALFAIDNSKLLYPYFEALNLFQQEKFEEGLKKYYKFLIFSDPVLSIESQKNDLKDAKAYFDNQIQLSENMPLAKLYISLYNRIIQNWEPAYNELDQLLSRYPDSNFLNFFKGEYLLAQGKDKEALLVFQKLKNPKGKKMLILAEILQKKHGINIAPDERKQILLKKGLRHLDLFENEKAVKILLQVMSEYPEDPIAPHELVDFFVRENKLNEAEKILAEWRKKDANGKNLYLPEARLRFKQKRYSDVLKILIPIFSADPQNEYIQFLIAESYFMNGDYNKALELLSAINKADPENIGILFRITAALEMTNNVLKAIDILNENIKTTTYNIPIKLELGSIYERIGHYNNAERIYFRLDSENQIWGALVNKRFKALEKLKAQKQSNSDTILATTFLNKTSEENMNDNKANLPAPDIEKILQDQKEILDIFFKN
ncbi:MAG: tetratricopeptide repeat protein [Massilibacteroides sp.]|nr:tetratricopeptide repeat protein [Massilibacteroides sp.]MDD3063183.1 tetratricopeptide repeat protein [Massilibacteroides sp.]